MKFRTYREIITWQKARKLANEVYRLFRNNRDFSFRDQIQRASVSTLSNIAEGYGRGSAKEFIRFLDIAKASVYEVQSLLDLAYDLGYINKLDELEKLHEDGEEIIRIIHGLVNQLKVRT